MDLNGKVALVTGAARRLGRAIATGVARRGAAVAVHYGSSAAAAEATAAELERLGVEAWPVAADLTEPRRIEEMFAAVGERFGRLDLLVNSAASFEDRDFEDIGADDWDAVQALNLRAPFLCIRCAAPLMRRRERPAGEPAAVVNIGDLSALQVWRRFAHHGVSKAGLLHLTRMAARDLAPAIRVNAVVPGAILPPPGASPDGEEWRRRGEIVPLGRTGRPEEVAHAVVFLAENDFITGAVVPVDGGERLTGR